jgi:hypothetical protein
MIQSHLYAKKAETPLYEKRGDNNQLLGMLNLGNWVGVLENEEGWYHVLTIQGDGWVRVEDVEERSPMNLQVRWEPGKPIEYVNAA